MLLAFSGEGPSLKGDFIRVLQFEILL